MHQYPFLATAFRLMLLIATGLSSLPSFAQQKEKPAQVSWGDEYKEPIGSELTKVVATDGEGFYVARAKNGLINTGSPNTIILEYYNRKMKIQRTREIDLKYKGKKREFEAILMVGGQLYLFTSFTNQVQLKHYLFVQKIRNEKLSVENDMTKIAEVESLDKFRSGTFGFYQSRDSSKLLIYNHMPYQKKEPERFAFHVFDKQLQEIWSKEISLPYPDAAYNVEEYQVDNNGNVYLLGTVYTDGNNTRRKGDPTYQYDILAYRNNGTEVVEYKIDLGEKFITDLTFRVADNGDLVCTGFYSEKGTYSIKGTYYFRLDPKTKEISNKNLRQFDFDFLTEYMSRKSKEKAKVAEKEGDTKRTAELYNYSLDNLILRSDGGALLVAEQYYVDQYINRYFDGRWDYTYYYNYNDIIVVNIRPNGEIEWTARIPKQQETRDDEGYYSSYAMSIVQDKIYFIYNDNPKNFGGDNTKRYDYTGSSSLVALSVVYKDGRVESFPLFNSKDADIVTRPKVCRQIGKHEMLIYGERGRTFRFGSLLLD